MLLNFIQHIRENKVLDVNGHYLLAVSGGIDSVVLAHLMKRWDFSFCMVHCNFQLRGKESEEDEIFIRNLGDLLGVEVLVEKFDTFTYKNEMGISTQMAARDLRYRWFGTLQSKMEVDGVVLAHHADDQLETVLLNLLRGTGIEGVYGMAEKRENFIRPLLPFTRKEIEGFANAENIYWREDSSNERSDYKRNFLRNEILPLLCKLDPAAPDLLRFSFERLKDTGKAFFYLYKGWKEKYIQQENGYEYLEFSSLPSGQGKKSLLYYWLREAGFNYFQMENIRAALGMGGSGKLFESQGFILNVDRNHLILGPKEKGFSEVLVDKHDIELDLGEDKFDLLVLQGQVTLDRSIQNAMLDKERLVFPLKVRKWQEGDVFRPLGMKNFKKISDLLIDLKIPLVRKKDIKVLCSGDDIVWVIGLRLDDRFKITPSTKTVVYFKKK